jgi:predicted AlkP superfamily phosphohydrolase/phosphomutase
MRRRTFVTSLLSAGGATLLASCGMSAGSRARGRRVIALAFDGLDPRITRRLMDDGRMPNFRQVAGLGTFTTIATSTPPITPVAFSSIVSGCEPGVHNIYDFIHRDPDPAGGALAVEPYMSMSKAVPPERDWAIPLGDWRLPLTGGSTTSLRRGPAFWEPLVQRGTDVDAYHIPGTYPPPQPEGEGRFRCLSGMGTPDLLGTYGEFTLLKSDLLVSERRVGGGRFVRLTLEDHVGEASIEGPRNFLRDPEAGALPPAMMRSLRIARDPDRALVRIDIGDEAIVLAAGEWSAWTPVTFQTGIPGSTVLAAAQAPTSINGMVRFFLKRVHPHLELYVSPVNIDPADQAMPISEPVGFGRSIARTNGRFYTTGIPEDTKALSRGALTERQFLAQSDIVMEEKLAEYRHALAHFNGGCLFSYFGTTDLVQHMFWRDRDPGHPGRIDEQGDQFADVIDDLYERVDAIVGETLNTMRDDDLLLILSDHGFTTFRRQLNLNRWLLENDWLTLKPAAERMGGDWLVDVDWSRTRAYAMGLNCLYLNLAGREREGIVTADQRDALVAAIAGELESLRDDDGSPVVDRVYDRRSLYPDADDRTAPDLIVGYAERYRASWATVQGGIPGELITDNHDRWSGTHCVSPRIMPGILLANRPLARDDAALADIAPTILGAFGVEPPAVMTGRDLFTMS